MPIVVPEPLMQHLMVVLGRRRACMHVLVSSLAEVGPLLLWYVVCILRSFSCGYGTVRRTGAVILTSQSRAPPRTSNNPQILIRRQITPIMAPRQSGGAGLNTTDIELQSVANRKKLNTL